MTRDGQLSRREWALLWIAEVVVTIGVVYTIVDMWR